MDHLNEKVILEVLGSEESNKIVGFEIHQEIDSTNQQLLNHARQGQRGPWVVLAEHQTMGRGRHGNTWVSPFASGVCLSLLWTFKGKTQHRMGLSLVVGISVIEALEKCGVTGLGLKWPNDLYWSERKLGGILIEFVERAGNPTQCIIGIGLNVCMSPSFEFSIDQPWIDLTTIGWKPIPRNHLVGLVLLGLLRTMRHFEVEGFSFFSETWKKYDVLKGNPVIVRTTHSRSIEGMCLGIDSEGAIQVRCEQENYTFTSGEVRLAVSREKRRGAGRAPAPK